MHFLPWSSTFLFLLRLSALDGETSYGLRQMQTRSLHNAVILSENLLSENGDGGIWRYLYPAEWKLDGCCIWRGTECTAGTLTTFVFTSYDANLRIWHIRAEWLPGTLRYVRIDHAVFQNDLSLKELPKALRYLCVRDGMLPNHFPNRTIHLEFLPAHIEELYLHINGALCGTVCIASLPQSLEICTVLNEWIDAAFVDNECLPANLKQICLLSGQIKLRSFRGGKVDNRVATKTKEGGKYIASKYVKEYEEMALKVKREAYVDAFEV